MGCRNRLSPGPFQNCAWLGEYPGALFGLCPVRCDVTVLIVPALLANQRINAMNDKTIEFDQTEVILTYQVADEALEAAAGTVKGKTGSYTLSFCSGLDTCPA
jgi:hypothetical protein